jgi:hypothetical protein
LQRGSSAHLFFLCFKKAKKKANGLAEINVLLKPYHMHNMPLTSNTIMTLNRVPIEVAFTVGWLVSQVVAQNPPPAKPCSHRLCACGSGQRAHRCKACDTVKVGICLKHGRRFEDCIPCVLAAPPERRARLMTPHSNICPCGIKRAMCRTHGGHALCASCRLVKVFRIGAFCATCRRARDGVPPVKSREMQIKRLLDAAAARGELPKYDSHDRQVNTSLDTSIYGAQRPDFLFKFDHHWVILEVDEHQHTAEGYLCERRREMNLFNSALGRSVILIRYNPDAFKTGSLSALQLARLAGATTVDRHKALLSWLRHAIYSPEKLLTNGNMFARVRLFYSCTCEGTGPTRRDHACGFAHVDVFRDDAHFAASGALNG